MAQHIINTARRLAVAAKGAQALYTADRLAIKVRGKLCSRIFSASTSPASHFPSGLKSDSLRDVGEDNRRKVNRLLYRSKQRGFLEMDLLVGLWAEKHVPSADEGLLSAFEEVLDQENPDLFKWLTGQLEAPRELQSNPAFKALQSSVGQQLRETVQQAARSQPGAEWVRGWDDWKKEANGKQ